MIIASGTPWWYDRFVMERPAVNQLKKGALEYCGVRSVKLAYFSMIINSTASQRKKWLDQVHKFGARMK